MMSNKLIDIIDLDNEVDIISEKINKEEKIKMKKYYCDGCNCAIEPHLSLYIYIEKYNNKEYHFCYNCKNKLYDFIGKLNNRR
jgi:hypothetical protein